MSGAFKVGAKHVFCLLWASPMKGFPYCLLSSGDSPACHHHATSLLEALLFPFAERFSVYLEGGIRENKENPSFQCVSTFCNVLLSYLGRSEECTFL